MLHTAAMVRRMHDRAHAGIVHNRLQPSLGGYLTHRTTNWLRKSYVRRLR